MSERGISEEDVERVHEDPLVTYPDGQGNRSLVGESNGKSIRIVVAGEDDSFVITAILLDQETPT